VRKILIYLIIFFIFLSSKTFASSKEEIIKNFIKTNNLSFDFKQTIQKTHEEFGDIKTKKETGNCIIEYPKLIYCLYDGKKRKVMVSNGKSLVIKNNHSNNSYIYSLKSTPLNYLLDKNYLLNQLKKIEPKSIKNNFINFKLVNEFTEMNIYFNKNNLNLAGWKTKDIYQNEVFFEIKNIKKNQVLDKKKFILPELN
tara:strand:+ start:445 stop:1035 length:591 start_codon:yes stop_codon:yes gene_type:complete